MEVRIWLLVVLLGIFVLHMMKYFWKKRNLFALSWKLPGPFALPIVGNGLIFFCKDEEIFGRAVNLVSKYASPMRLWLGPKLFILFRKPYQIEKIMISSLFSAKDEGVYKLMKEFNGNGMITESGPKWKNDRKILSPLFTMKTMKKFIPSMVHHSKILLQKLDKEANKSVFNVKNPIQRCLCDLISETIIGVSTQAHTGAMDSYLNTISRMYILVHSRIVKFWLQIEWIFKYTCYYEEQEKGKMVVHGFMKNGYDKINSSYNNNSVSDINQSLLIEMLKIRDVMPNFANDQDFVYHLTTFYSASEDTITIISSFALVLFGLFPNIQQRAFEEVNSVLPNNKMIEEEDIDRMEYLERCIKDVLRLFPIAPFIIRTASEDCFVDQIEIPKGCSVIVAIHNVHRDPEFWETPNTFNPDHFLSEEVKKRPKYAYLPFSAGTRSCLGKIYAMLGLKIILASILREFAIYSEGKFEDYKIKADISVRFHNDKYPVRLRRRR